MKVAIHQPHYFPWLGYLNKMSNVDKFILLDDVQLTDSSNMFRNQLLTLNGSQKYITIPFIKNGYMQKSYNQLEINPLIDWQKLHSNFIKENYRKAPFFNEVWEKIKIIFEKKYFLLSDVTIDTILLLKDIFNISTEILMQSKLEYPSDSKKNQLVLDLCIAVKSNYYLSGKGAKKYMELNPFTEKGIVVEFQNFNMAEYPQFSNKNRLFGFQDI